MQLRHLVNATLKKSEKAKQTNGVEVAVYVFVGDYQIQTQELTDEISATIYGADINSMLRVKSPFASLETFLKSKVNNTADNVSKYFLYVNNKQYKIKSVKNNWVDIQDTGLTEDVISL